LIPTTSCLSFAPLIKNSLLLSSSTYHQVLLHFGRNFGHRKMGCLSLVAVN
jgi:hypothetical protein